MEPFTNLCYDVKELNKNGEFWKLVKFLLFDICFITLDVILDIRTSVQFFEDGDPHWGTLNVCFLILPVVCRFITCFIEDLSWKGTLNAFWKAFLCLPIIQTFRGIWRLHQMRQQAVFLTSTENLYKVKKENAEAAIFEGFLEAAPSQVLNLHILLLTGSISETQVASVCTSMISLTLTAERVYFLYRSKDEEDVDPSLKLQLLVLPFMLLNTISNTILWSVLSANSNAGVIYCIIFVLTINWAVLKSCNSFISVEQITSPPLALSILTTWIPSPLGSGRKMFRSLSISSYFSKFALITVIWWLRWLDASFLPHPPLTTCAEAKENVSIAYCYNITDCFCGFHCEDKKQKIR